MKTKAIISKIMPPVTRTSRTGREFTKQQIVVDIYETASTLTKLALDVPFDDTMAKIAAFKVGDEVVIDYRVSSHEWEGRWFTEATLYNIEPGIKPAAAPVQEKDPFDDLPL